MSFFCQGKFRFKTLLFTRKNFLSFIPGYGTVINYGSVSDFFNKLQFRFRKSKSYDSYNSGFATLVTSTSRSPHVCKVLKNQCLWMLSKMPTEGTRLTEFQDWWEARAEATLANPPGPTEINHQVTEVSKPPDARWWWREECWAPPCRTPPRWPWSGPAGSGAPANVNYNFPIRTRLFSTFLLRILPTVFRCSCLPSTFIQNDSSSVVTLWIVLRIRMQAALIWNEFETKLPW